MNKVLMVGRIGKDPEVFEFENGNKKTSFSIAVDDGYYSKDKGEWVEQTEWVNVALFKETKLIKGDLIWIEGKLKTRSYEKDDEKRYVTEVNASNARLMSRKGDTPNKPAPKADEITGDLPF